MKPQSSPRKISAGNARWNQIEKQTKLLTGTYPHTDITRKFIACAIEVHKTLGPGLLESLYEEALAREMVLQKVNFSRQHRVTLEYKGVTIGEHRLDFLVENSVVVEIKAVDHLIPVFEAQLLTYLNATSKKVGLLVNFNVGLLKQGIKRLVL